MGEHPDDSVIEQLREVIRRSAGALTSSPTLELVIEAVAMSGLAYLNKRREDLTPLVKMAWNYDESWRGSYTLDEAIAWFKSNMPRGVSAGCLLRLRPDARHPYHRLHHCFLNDAREPLLSGDHPHRVVNTKTLGDSLHRQFAGKDMIVFR